MNALAHLSLIFLLLATPFGAFCHTGGMSVCRAPGMGASDAEPSNDGCCDVALGENCCPTPSPEQANLGGDGAEREAAKKVASWVIVGAVAPSADFDPHCERAASCASSTASLQAQHVRIQI